MHYRPEIDGLRAVAVVPVILFHAGVTLFSGGYVGVDIFFVISGYLITSIILTELAENRFSIVRFYERRARRILPALFVMMACCIPFAWSWMLPSQYSAFSRSMAATALFISNGHFWETTGYFGANTQLMPLLHTWSLAVEEQYYIVFPVLLVLLRRFGAPVNLLVVAALGLASLAVSEWGWRFRPDANFYFTLSRVWEILVGSICAFLSVGRPQRSSNLLAGLGLAMIGWAIFAFDETTPFPSLHTLVPVLGTALIVLFAATGTWVARLLSWRIFVGIGIISYSAYLWHQPVFAFARIRAMTEPSQPIMLGLVAVIMALAYLSWRFIEQPFRRRGPIPWPRRSVVFAASGTIGAMFIAFGMFGVAGNGLGGRMNDDAIRYANFENDISPNRSSCHIEAGKRTPTHPIPQCLYSSDGSIDVVFLGDSHSSAISHEAQKLLLERGINSYGVSYSSCIGLSGFVKTTRKQTAECDDYNEGIKAFIRQQGVTTIVLTSRFTIYWSGESFDNGEGGLERAITDPVEPIADINSDVPEDIRREHVLGAYRTAIAALADEFNVVLIYPIPEAGWNVPLRLAQLRLFSDEKMPEVSTSSALFTQRNQPIIDLFDTIQSPNLFAVKPGEILCDTALPGRCLNILDDNVLYVDDDHLSNAGARLLAPDILQQVQAALHHDLGSPRQ